LHVTPGHAITVPGTGTFFVGIDISPGRYRCANAKGGWWVRFTGSGGERGVGMWPLPAGPAEVDIAPDDFAFETRVPSHWELVSRTSPADAGGPADRVAGDGADGTGAGPPRAVADPSLRGELDALVADRGHKLRLRVSRLSMLALCLLAFVFLGPWSGVTIVPIALTGLLVGFLGDDVRRARALRGRRDRYLTPDDFDATGQDLLTRVQGAIDAVRESEVNRQGLLDRVDNEVTLPREEWEIAQVLARQSKLRREQQEMLEFSAVPEVEAAVRPLRDKLAISVEAVTRRIEALEQYAERTRAADEAYRAQRRLEALTVRAHEYDDLVADAVRDDLALTAIDRLTRQSDELVRTLRERLTEAGGAAAELPPDEPHPGSNSDSGSDSGSGARPD
jgi:nucleotide-binding universal stress UspA family protein